LLLLVLSICPPTMNSRSTAADDSNVVLNWIKLTLLHDIYAALLTTNLDLQDNDQNTSVWAKIMKTIRFSLVIDLPCSTRLATIVLNCFASVVLTINCQLEVS